MVSKLWLPIQEHINCIDGSMPAVHHYTTINGALGILENGRIWFTERAHLNDRSEISHGVQIAVDALRKQGRMDEAAHLAHSACTVFRDFRFFSASFSFAYDDLSQWMKYADGGKGILLSFKASAFNTPKAFVDRLITGNPTVFVCPMSYDSRRLRSVIASIIECWDGRNIDELSDHIFMISGMFKDNCWKREKEYRFFVHHQYAKISRSTYHKTRKRDDQEISYLDLPLQNWNSESDFPIYRITVGPDAPHEVDMRLSDFIQSENIFLQEPIRKSELYNTTRQRAIRELRRMVLDALGEHDAEVWLFGSCARGEVLQHSDIDIAILPRDELPSGFFSNLAESVEASAIPYDVDLVDLRRAAPSLVDEVHREGVKWKG